MDLRAVGLWGAQSREERVPTDSKDLIMSFSTCNTFITTPSSSANIAYYYNKKLTGTKTT
jgi:hypothetical protein